MHKGPVDHLSWMFYCIKYAFKNSVSGKRDILMTDLWIYIKIHNLKEKLAFFHIFRLSGNNSLADWFFLFVIDII